MMTETVVAVDLLENMRSLLVVHKEKKIRIVRKRMEELHIPKKDLEWYLDLRRCGGSSTQDLVWICHFYLSNRG